jgi:hypothetical protein
VKYWHGIPAADGGFLHITMATRGDTGMERLVLRKGLVAEEHVSQDFQNSQWDSGG